MYKLWPVLIAVIMLSCNTGKKEKTGSGDSVVLASANIPAARSKVNPNPVETYIDTVRSFETTDIFKVQLFETHQTFNYLIKISYKNIETNDTLRVPNLGVQPSVKIIKGNRKPSCIVGFSDKNRQFKESKEVYFKDNKLKVHVLKYYAVYAADTVR